MPRPAGRARANQTGETNNWGNRSGAAVDRPLYGETGPRGGRTIEGELIVKSVADGPPAFDVGDRVRHRKFGDGTVTLVEGNKLTIKFDQGAEKRVLDGFVTAVE